ncbi:MAG: hypothetical protein E6I84_04230 [Chloroflexi bacterium]|nr:MAG: hypothetical protein E6I84_04230 [Chloroflexota bacterium]
MSCRLQLVWHGALGEYSDGCICQLPGKHVSADAAAATLATIVDMQERARRANLRRSVRDMDVWNPAKGNFCPWNAAPECFDQ